MEKEKQYIPCTTLLQSDQISSQLLSINPLLLLMQGRKWGAKEQLVQCFFSGPLGGKFPLPPPKFKFPLQTIKIFVCFLDVFHIFSPHKSNSLHFQKKKNPAAETSTAATNSVLVNMHHCKNTWVTLTTLLSCPNCISVTKECYQTGFLVVH